MPLDPHEESRLRMLEDSHIQQTQLYQQMTGTLNQIHNDLRASINIQGLVTDHDKQLKKLWIKIDECEALGTSFKLLNAEHAACKPIVDTVATCKLDFEHRVRSLENRLAEVGGFAKNIVGGWLGQLFWGLTIAGALAAIWLAGKGAFRL